MFGAVLALDPSIMSTISCLRVVGTAAALVIAADAHAGGISLSEKPNHVTEAVIANL